jgi:hypothetical protein
MQCAGLAVAGIEENYPRECTDAARGKSFTEFEIVLRCEKTLLEL